MSRYSVEVAPRGGISPFYKAPPTASRKELLHSRFRDGLRYLLTHLKVSEDGCGSLFESPARSRVLETALLMHLLRKEKMRPDWQRRLSQYLLMQGARTDPMSRLIASAVLENSPAGDALSPLRQIIKGLEYGKRRKQAMLVMMLVELDVLSFEEAQVPMEDFAEQASHRFSQLYGAALRLMHHRRSGLHPEPERDISFLVHCQAPNGSWEQQTLITLLAMIALGRQHPAFSRGMEFLETVEREDGGIPFIDNQNIWVTSLAGLALQAARVLPEVQEQIANFIVSRQQDNGGWTFTDGVIQTDTDDTANCVQLLLQRDPRLYAPTVDRALAYFSRLQRDDGGYPTYERMGESELTMTANIMLVQSLCLPRKPELRPALRAAGRYLLEHQRTDGGFEKSWSLSETYSIFRVLWALEAYMRVDGDLPAEHMRAMALRFLLENQNSDGGWGQGEGKPSDALSSAYALATLSLVRDQLAVEPLIITRTTQYLYSQQDLETGEFISIPDVAGPRPIVFDVPLLSTVFSLLALSFAQSGRHNEA